MAEFKVSPRKNNRWALWVFIVIVAMTLLFFFIRNYKSGPKPLDSIPDSVIIDKKE